MLCGAWRVSNSVFMRISQTTVHVMKPDCQKPQTFFFINVDTQLIIFFFHFNNEICCVLKQQDQIILEKQYFTLSLLIRIIYYH